MEDGSREWQPVQEIVRLTFKSFNEIIRAQGEAIQNFERALEGKANKSESTSALAEKVNVAELTNTFEDLSRIIDAKTDSQENTVALERKAGRIEVQGALKLKADTAEVQRCLDQKANVEEVNEVVARLEHELAETQARLEAKSNELLEAKATAQAEAREAAQSVDAKVDALRAELQSTFAVKASHAQVEALVAEQGLTTLSALGGKADVEAVGAALAAKASRAELLEMVDGRSAELRDETQRLLAERVARPELQTHTIETERRFKELRAEVSSARLDVQAHAAEVHGCLAGKASLADVEARVERGEMERQLQRRPERAEVEAALGDTARRQAEAAQGAREAKADLEAAAERLERQLESLTEEVRGLSSSLVGSGEDLARSASEAAAALALKADAVALEAACGDLEARLGEKADVSALARKVDAMQLAAAVSQQLHATNVPDALATIDRKANVEDVNRSLLEVNRELSQRPTLGELNRVVGEQSLIMESLCSEHLLGRWIWKSGRTKGEKHLVPWNVQNINTNPDNFAWEKDRAVIGCAAPGLYEVSFGFFTRRKPTVQLLVNGEPVLSAINSASYAVHHSSGRLAAVGPHTAGNVTGLTLLDFLALPPKAKVSCTFQGEDGGEGFLSLRKM